MSHYTASSNNKNKDKAIVRLFGSSREEVMTRWSSVDVCVDEIVSLSGTVHHVEEDRLSH